MIRLEHRRHITDCSSCLHSGPDTRVLSFSRTNANVTSSIVVAVCPACLVDLHADLHQIVASDIKETK